METPIGGADVSCYCKPKIEELEENSLGGKVCQKLLLLNEFNIREGVEWQALDFGQICR